MFEAALSKGEITAYAGLAFLYLEKESPLYSPEKAEQCLTDAIARDCHHCEYLLGRWLYEGKELEEDKERGLKLLEAAAESGHGVANNYINFCVEDRFAKLLQQQFLNALPVLGTNADTPKQGRNEPCSCDSGKKYKKCCGA